jgi:transglutaminase/protease-like cytokinesis protein 3
MKLDAEIFAVSNKTMSKTYCKKQVFTKVVRNAAHQDQCTNDIYATLIEVPSPTILPLSAQLERHP